MSKRKPAKKKPEKPPFKIGDLVTTGFYSSEKDVIRRITECVRSDRTDCGWAVSADGGDACPTCGRMLGTQIQHVSAGWLEKVKKP